MNLSSLFERRMLWTIALYKLKDEKEVFELDKHEPIHFFGETGIRRNAGYQAITTDPFLFVHAQRLYLFYEVKTDFGVGEIWAQSMDVHGTWTNHRQVLKESFHLSYPQVFRYAGQIWMIPEAASSGKVWLYTAKVFPNIWHRKKVLIDEPLLDPSIVILKDGVFLLGTTRAYELKIYFAPDLMEEFISTGIDITNDKSIARNGGRPLLIQNILYRVAQNCKRFYGQNISLHQVTQLTIKKYSEQLSIPELYRDIPKWATGGYHHLSTAWFGTEHYYVAVDGMRKDKYMNTVLLAILKLIRFGRRILIGS